MSYYIMVPLDCNVQIMKAIFPIESTNTINV